MYFKGNLLSFCIFFKIIVIWIRENFLKEFSKVYKNGDVIKLFYKLIMIFIKINIDESGFKG